MYGLKPVPFTQTGFFRQILRKITTYPFKNRKAFAAQCGVFALIEPSVAFKNAA
jgi:hypothetical protein